MFSSSVRTTVEIEAPADRVWQLLLDWPHYASWNPFLTSVEGEAVEGSRIKIFARPPGQKGMSFSPVLLKVAPHKELRWRGRLLLPGLFDGEHYFQLEQLGPGRVKFVHGEDFSGLLVPLVSASGFAGVQQGFEEMNAKLKELAEARE